MHQEPAIGLLNGSEPVTMSAIEKFTAAFAPYGLPATAVTPSYGMARGDAGGSIATMRRPAPYSSTAFDSPPGGR